MDDREACRRLDEVSKSIADLSRLLDEAAVRAVDIGADDTLTRIAAAKIATKRGTDCVTRLRQALLGEREAALLKDHQSASDRRI